MPDKCHKVCYKTRKAAQRNCKVIKRPRAVLSTGRKRKPTVYKLTPYYCKKCGSWHLTSKA